MPRRPTPRLRCEPLDDRATPSAAPYGLDPTFGEAGGARTGPVADGSTVRAAVATDGGLVVLGFQGGQAVVARFTPAGTLDSSFDGDGVKAIGPAAVPGVEYASFQDLAVQPDGRIVLVGSGVPVAPDGLADPTRSYDFLVVRLDAGGALDASFGGGDGVALVGFGGDGSGKSDWAAAVAFGPGGAVVVAGTTRSTSLPVPAPDGVAYCGVGLYGPSALAVARLTADGAPDAGFDGDGRATLVADPESAGVGDTALPVFTPPAGPPSLTATDVAVGPGGEVVVVGSRTPDIFAGWPADGSAYAYVARFTAAGQLDPAFGVGGVATRLDPDQPATPDGAADPRFPPAPVYSSAVFPSTYGHRVAVLADGRVLVSASVTGWPRVLEDATLDDYSSRARVTRLAADGTIDPTYGTGGAAVAVDSRGFADMAVDAAGRAVLVTGADVNRSPYTYAVPAGTASVYRLTPDGQPDAGFAAGGSALSVAEGTWSTPYAGGAVAVDADGRVLVAGHYGGWPGGSTAGGVWAARLVPGGTGEPLTPRPEDVPGVVVVCFPGGPRVDPEYWPGPDTPPPVVLLPADAPGGGERPESAPDGPAPSKPPARVRLSAPAVAVGGEPTLTVYNPDGSVRFVLPVFESSFTGGVAVALADVNGDGVDDVVASAGDGGGPRVKVFDGATGQVLADFFAFDASWRGGVSVAAGDFDGDGLADLAVGAAAGGGPRVLVYRGAGVAAGSPGVAASLFALEDVDYRGGLTLAAADLSGDGRAELAVDPGPGRPAAALDPAELVSGRAVPAAGVDPDAILLGAAVG